MTENEAIKEFEEWLDRASAYRETCEVVEKSDHVLAMETAIQALEEIQQYRAIGTVEQLRTMFDGFWKLKDLCEEYEKYGLPEDYWKLNEMCKEYSAIGTVEEFKTLKEKSVAKKVKGKHMSDSLEERQLCGEYTLYGYCPNCGESITNLWNSVNCGDCGQKLDWK